MAGKYTNAAMAGGWVITLIGILDDIGRAETAKTLYGLAVFELRGFQVNWDALYVYGFVFISVFWIALNWDALFLLYRRYLRGPQWDLPLNAALLHVGGVANVSDAFPPVPEVRIVEAKRELEARLRTGKLRIKGRRKGVPPAVEIPRQEWEGAEIWHVMGRSNAFGGPPPISSWMIEKGQPNKSLFDALMLNSEEVYREFPPFPSDS